jgi:hypothetical protein
VPALRRLVAGDQGRAAIDAELEIISCQVVLGDMSERLLKKFAPRVLVDEAPSKGICWQRQWTGQLEQ